MVTLFPFVFDATVFQSAEAFNGDLSKWQTNRVTNMDYTFYDARSFNHKTTLDIAWEANSPSVYPGIDMFYNTCSLDPNCGKCSSKNTNGDAVTCSSATQPAKASSTVCIFCSNDDYECCTPKMLPDGNGESEAAKRAGYTGYTLNRIVDDWLDPAKRSAVEAIYGLIVDWDVSLVKNFERLFWDKTTFNSDISKWNVAGAENMGTSECCPLSFHLIPFICCSFFLRSLFCFLFVSFSFLSSYKTQQSFTTADSQELCAVARCRLLQKIRLLVSPNNGMP